MTQMTPEKIEDRSLTDSWAMFADDEFENDRLTKAGYYQNLLSIANEYLVDHDDEEACLRTLNKIDPDWIRLEMAECMKADAELASEVLILAYHLERRGITFEGVIRPTQAEAKA